MWRESLIFERDGSWMRFGLPTKKKKSTVESMNQEDPRSDLFFFFFPNDDY